MESTFIAFRHIYLMLMTNANWQSVAKWSATFFMAVSAIIVSFSVEWSGYAITFFGFFLGHVLWATSAWVMRERALLVLNIGFIPIDIYAMYIRT